MFPTYAKKLPLVVRSVKYFKKKNCQDRSKSNWNYTPVFTIGSADTHARSSGGFIGARCGNDLSLLLYARQVMLDEAQGGR